MDSYLKPKNTAKNRITVICLLVSVFFTGITAVYAGASTTTGADNIATMVCSLIAEGDFDLAGSVLDRAQGGH